MVPRPDLFRTGSPARPAQIRPGLDYRLDDRGYVRRAESDGRPAGLSAFDSETRLVTSGRIWRLRADAPLPDGLEAVAGRGGHYVIRPAADLTEADYLDRLARLPWEDTGRERRRR